MVDARDLKKFECIPYVDGLTLANGIKDYSPPR